ncbi:sulfur oxidation c-type cytochrome SoxA [Devosia rhizoryzae]|uniref:SoxAX cytochrome complex subunit A n=1 Tax=Devosia rhizoryzae TaxID=2774137 RepID=A0ABX7C4X3_9HYPH|nr:sulfur oxidation c-type cytochrome SoxA [Devosia rhizoryzae]QQR39292.1 sulfur oxidation c-type cytochrome SoxA [Devosia rhizoryzae]
MNFVPAIALAVGLVAAIGLVDAAPHSEPRSGYSFLTPELQQLQDDDFANPGLLWVDQGATLWETAAGTSNRSCADCHGDASVSMRGVAPRYPAYSEELGRMVNIEGQINQCRSARQGAEPLPYESEDLLSLTAFVSNQSAGLPISLAVVGPAAESLERGRAFFYQRRGQLNLSCANCHEDNVGNHLRAEPISEGQTNGFPIYRNLWQTMGSTHRMFAWCNEAVRAEPYAAGSQDYIDLEVFERWRSNGLTIETPAVRR